MTQRSSRSWYQRLFSFLAWLFVGWVALVVLVVTPIVNILIDDKVSSLLGRDFRSGIVLIDPVGFAVSAESLTVEGVAGGKQLTIPRVAIDVGLFATLLNQTVTVESIAVNDVVATLSRRADGSFDIDDVVTRLTTDTGEPKEPEPATEATAIAWLVESVTVSLERITFSDAMAPKGFTNGVQNLALNGANIGSHHGAGDIALSFSVLSGGDVDLAGELNLAESSVKAETDIQGFMLPPWWDYASGLPEARLMSGVYGGSIDVDLNFAGNLKGVVTLNDHRLADVALSPASGDSDLTGIKLADISLTALTADLTNTAVNVGPLTVNGLQVRTDFVDNQLSLLEALTPPSGAGDDALATATAPSSEDSTRPTAEPSPPAPASNNAASNTDWSIQTASFNVENSGVTVTTPLVKPGMIAIDDIALSLDQAAWPSSVDSAISLALTVNQQATLSVEGSGDLVAGDLETRTALSALPLNWFEPLIADFLNTQLTGGETSLTLTAVLKEFQPSALEGRVEIDNFYGELPNADEPLAGFKQLRLEGIAVDFADHHAIIEDVHLTGAKTAIRLFEDGSINVGEVVNQSAVANAVEADQPPVPAAGPEVVPEPGEAWRITVPDIFLYESALKFRDDSLAVQFTAEIEDLFGEIKGFDTQADTTLSVDMKGVIDGFAPVVVDGNLGHVTDPKNGDLTMTMRGVDLARLTPYSATYAGYPITQGVMSVDLNYGLDQGKIQGNNHVVVERLRLGERDPRSDAGNLPIKAAIALLSDVAGVIDVSLDVSGSTEDPNFHIASALAQAASNLIVNVVAAPFKLLASLAGEEEVPDTVRFGAGSAVLSDNARGNLDVIVEGLVQRPQLALILSPQVDRNLDKTRMARNALKAELVTSGLSMEAIEKRGSEWELAINQRAAEAGLDAELSPIEKYRALAAAIPISEDDLKQLASDRAAAIKAYLVNVDGFDPQRAVISQWDVASEDFTGVTLSVEAL